jgi:hypothetical protein
MLIMCKNEKKKQYVPGLSLQEEKKKMFDLTQKLQRNNIFCFN